MSEMVFLSLQRVGQFNLLPSFNIARRSLLFNVLPSTTPNSCNEEDLAAFKSSLEKATIFVIVRGTYPPSQNVPLLF